MTDSARPEVEVDTRIAAAYTTYAKARNERDRLGAYKAGSFQPRDLQARLDAADIALAAAAAAYRTADDEYQGWSRFYIVPGGHIHSTLNCSTCNRAGALTEFAWLPELSGLTEADAVDEYGGILCSVCFQSAPVEWTTGVNLRDAAEKAAAERLRALGKLPEAKAVIAKRNLVNSKTQRIAGHERALARFEERSAEPVEPGWEIPAFVTRDAERATVELPKLRKQLARAEAALADAELVLAELLGRVA